jgi:DNA-binding transcriptional MocR family regulator
MDNKYQMVIEHMKSQLAAGSMKPGERLPSIRGLSQQFGCSTNTVIRAYDDLEKQHLIYSVPKSGYYAVVQSNTTNLQLSGKIDFSSAAPDPAVMPYEDFQHCLNQAIGLYQDQLFSYSDPQGFSSLRETLSNHLTGSQIYAKPEQICVVSGAQQALHLLAAMPFPNGKHVILVEQPTYFGMLRSLDLLGITVIGIERTKNGIDLEELERHFRNNNIKFFYTVPRYHNPLGTSYNREQKKQIARLAEKYGVYIVEDDYLGDLATDRKEDPIYSEDRSGHTVYIKSFSKVMLPGLRLGVAVLPKPLLETFRLFKASSDSSTATLSQAALEIYINCGMFDRHVKGMRDRYRSRMGALRAACDRYIQWMEPIHETSSVFPEGGIFATVPLPERLSATDLTASLQLHNIGVMPTGRCYLRTFPKENGIRISIIRTDESQIEQGIQRIAEVAAEMLMHKPTTEMESVIEWI